MHCISPEHFSKRGAESGAGRTAPLPVAMIVMVPLTPQGWQAFGVGPPCTAPAIPVPLVHSCPLPAGLCSPRSRGLAGPWPASQSAGPTHRTGAWAQLLPGDSRSLDGAFPLLYRDTFVPTWVLSRRPHPCCTADASLAAAPAPLVAVDREPSSVPAGAVPSTPWRDALLAGGGPWGRRGCFLCAAGPGPRAPAAVASPS